MVSRRILLLQFSGFVSYMSAQQSASDELRSELANTDMALGRVNGESLEIRPFDSAPVSRRLIGTPLLEGSEAKLVDVSWASNSAGIVYSYRILGQRASLSIVEVSGGILWSIEEMPVASIGVPAVAPDLQRVAFVSRSSERIWISLMDKDGSVQEIFSESVPTQLKNPTVNWHTDGRSIAGSWGGDVFVCDLDSNISEKRLKGTDPSWSPLGNYFSYKDSEGRVVILDDANDQVFRTRRTVVSPPAIIWSPNERYFICNQEASDPKRVSSDVILYSVRDSRELLLWDNRGRRMSNIGWIEDWRSVANDLPAI